jgi:hypothetical protein
MEAKHTGLPGSGLLSLGRNFAMNKMSKHEFIRNARNTVVPVNDVGVTDNNNNHNSPSTSNRPQLITLTKRSRRRENSPER